MRFWFFLVITPFLASCHGLRGTAQSLEANPSGAAHPVFERARSAFDFVNSIGVNMHLNYFDRTYGDFGLVERELQSIGIRHVRDGIHLQNADYNKALYSRWVELAKHGVRFDAVLDPRSNLGPLTPELLKQVEELSGHSIESFEGPNELDISGQASWVEVDRNYQREIDSAAKAMNAAGHVSVIAPSLAFASHGLALGSLKDYIDEGNLHPYPAAKPPSIVFPEQTVLAKLVSGEKPVVITESGYHNALNDHRDQPAVSEDAAAKYVPRLFLEDFSRGIPRTYLYEFLDETPDPGLTDNQMHWGLIRADGSEKPAFVAVKRLIEELNDNASPASLGQLSWSLANPGSAIHHLLLQKSDGEFDLVLWQEIESFNPRQQKEIDNHPVADVLALGQRARRITLYEPLKSSAPIATFADTASVPLEIHDHPLVVAIQIGGN
jgi:hypothetical protein